MARTSLKSPMPVNYPTVRNLLGALSLSAVAASAATISTDGRPPVVMGGVVVSEPKTHALFMGADISVDFQNDLRPVKDVFGASWVILVDGQERHISTKQATVGIQVTPSLKLTDTFAAIADFMKTPSYSFDNDPSVKITKGLTRASVVSSFLHGVASDRQGLADTIGNKALGGAALMAGEASIQFGDAALVNCGLHLPAVADYISP
jgi:hypothetical protein